MLKQTVQPSVSAFSLFIFCLLAFYVTTLQLRGLAQNTLERWGVPATKINHVPIITKNGVKFYFVQAHEKYYIWGNVVVNPHSSENQVTTHMRKKPEYEKIEI